METTSGMIWHTTTSWYLYFFIFHFNALTIVFQEEIAEMKRKMKTMNNQVTRLRDEISGKELALAKDQQELKHLEKDNKALKVLPWVPRAALHHCFIIYLFLLDKTCTIMQKQNIQNLFILFGLIHCLCPFTGRAAAGEVPAGRNTAAC